MTEDKRTTLSQDALELSRELTRISQLSGSLLLRQVRSFAGA